MAVAIAVKEYEEAARAFKLEFRSLAIRGPVPDFAGAFQTAKTARLDALIVVANPLMAQHAKEVFELAAKYRLPSMTEEGRFVSAGGLISYGVDVLDGLGSTEMLHIFLSNSPGDVKYGTSGKPVPGYDIRLVGDDGNVITDAGEMGELQVRGPTSAVMYWNNREQSRTTFLGEWTRSGDKYVQDEQGYYVYCGRRDDMLKVGGIYVSPFEVEGALQSHPDVLEAAVVAWPDDDELIKPKAFVVLKSANAACDTLAVALQEHCKQKLAPYKYPRWIEFRGDLPKTATGKIQRFKLRAEIGSR